MTNIDKLLGGKNIKFYVHDDHFGGAVALAYEDDGDGWLEVEVWVFNDLPYYWWVEVNNTSDEIKNHDDLLEELKKEKYETEGTSETIDRSMEDDFRKSFAN